MSLVCGDHRSNGKGIQSHSPSGTGGAQERARARQDMRYKYLLKSILAWEAKGRGKQGAQEYTATLETQE